MDTEEKVEQGGTKAEINKLVDAIEQANSVKMLVLGQMKQCGWNRFAALNWFLLR